MQHQDWQEVVFKKTVGKGTTTARSASVETASSVSSKPAWKIEMDVDSETSKRPLELVNREDAQRIVRGRCDKKLTQKDLATKLNMQFARSMRDVRLMGYHAARCKPSTTAELHLKYTRVAAMLGLDQAHEFIDLYVSRLMMTDRKDVETCFPERCLWPDVSRRRVVVDVGSCSIL